MLRQVLAVSSVLLVLGIVSLRAATPAPVHVVDLLMLYTGTAATGAGGEQALYAQAETAVSEANRVFQQSEVQVRVRLVNFVFVDYTESGSVATDLARLRTPGDGALDWAQLWRDWTGADLVCLITESGSDWNFYGLQGPSAANAYSILRRPFLTGQFYLPVVLSFNFGCQLERPFADSVSAFSFAYGYSFQDTNGNFFSTVDAFNGTRLPFFSNPNKLWNGARVGVPSGRVNACDNTRALNLTAPLVASFRAPAPVTLPPAVDLALPATDTRLSPGDTLRFQPRVADADGSVARVDFFAGNRWIGNATAPFAFNWSATLIGHYDVFAVATDDAGASTVSDVVRVHCTWLNDDFQNRAPLAGTNLTWPVANWFASKEPGEPDHAGDAGGQSLWWSWTAPAHGTVTLSTVNHAASALLAVYTGDALGTLMSVTHNWGGWATEISFPVELGRTYQIAVDGQFGLAVNSMLRLQFTPVPRVELVSPANGAVFPAGSNILVEAAASASDGSVPARVEFFDGGALLATVTNPPFRFSWSNAAAGGHTFSARVVEYGGASNASASVSIGVTPSNDTFDTRIPIAGTNLWFMATTYYSQSGAVWWTWVPPSRGHVWVSISGYDAFAWPQIAAYTGSAETNLTGVGGRQGWRVASIEFDAQAGVAYHLAVSGGYGTGGQFSFQLLFAPSPDNDDFANAFPLGPAGGVMTGDTSGASIEPGEPGYYGAKPSSLWWRWIAPVTGWARLSSEAQEWIHAGVYTGETVSNLTNIATGGSSSYGWFPETSWLASAGTEYRIAVNAFLADRGPISLRLEPLRITLLTPTNGAKFTAPEPITLTASPDDVNHTVRRVDFLDGSTRLGSVTNAPYVFVWTNAPLGDHTLCAAVVGEEGTTNAAPSAAIRVGPANDDFAHRTVLTGTNFITAGSIIGATKETNEPPTTLYSGSHSTWYSWTAPVAGRVTLTPSGFGPILLDAFRGDALTNLTLITGGYASTIVWDLLAGETCVIRADGEGGYTGNFNLTLNFVPAPPDVVTLTAPANGAILRTNQIVSLVAETHPSVLSVRFFANDVLLGVVTNVPFMWWWTNPPAGASTLRAEATASIPANTNSPTVAVTVLPPGPINDDFANRLALAGASITVTGSVTYAAREPGEPQHSCWVSGRTVWYSWIAPANGKARVSLDSPSMDRVVTVYKAPWAPFPRMGIQGCMSDRVLFDVVAGQSFDIVVEQGASGPDEFVLRVEMLLAWIASPINGAEFVAGMDVPLTVTNAADAQRVEFFDGTNSLGVSVTPPFDFTWTNVPTGEHALTLLTTDAAGLITASEPLDVIVRPVNDQFINRFVLDPGALPLIIQANNTAATGETNEPAHEAGGSRTLWWSWTAPSNGLLVIRGGGDFALSGSIPPWTRVCWCEDTAHTRRQAARRIPVSPPLGGPLVFVFEGETLAGLQMLTNNAVRLATFERLPGENSGYAFWSVSPSCAVTVRAGQTLQIALDGCNGTSGEATLELELFPAPANDAFAQRITFSGVTAALRGDNTAATTEPGEILPAGASGRTLWWSWIAPGDGTVTVADTGGGLVVPPLAFSQPTIPADATTTQSEMGGVVIIGQPENIPPAGSLSGPAVSIYSGTALGGLTLLATNTCYYPGGGFWFCEWPSGVCHQLYPAGWYALPQLTFPVVAGQSYQLSLDGANGHTGVGTLGWTFTPKPPPPANDDFTNRITLAGSDPVAEGTTVSATRESGEPMHGLNSRARTVWYSWTAPGSGNVSFDTYCPGGAVVVAIYAGRVLVHLTSVAEPATAAGLSFFAVEGATYQIAVTGADGLESSFWLYLHGPPAAPSFQQGVAARLPDGTFQLPIAGSLGQSFLVEASTNLVDWQTLQVETLVDGNFNFLDSDAANYDRRFYRLRSLESVLAAAPLRLAAGWMSGGGHFTLRVTGTPGQPFSVQASSDLRRWSDVGAGILQSEVADWIDPTAADVSHRFYRVRP